MSHDHNHDSLEEAVRSGAIWSQGFWEQRYGASERIWSGNPNQRLVEQAADLAPGTALDVGCGEGADAIWLAERGWQVTAADISTVALARGAEAAARAGKEIASRITWEQADMRSWDPSPRQFDLVSIQFVHVPHDLMEVLHRRLAQAVRPGGSLLIVEHHPSDLETTIGRPNFPELVNTPEQIAAALDAADWEIVMAAEPARQATDPEGRSVTIRDTVLHAVRRA